MSTATILTAAEAAHKTILDNEADIESLDRAIGDGDHYHNLKRGAETVAAMADDLSAMEADAALKAIGMKLMSTIGGASGPLISSFILAMAKTEGAADPWTTPTVARMFRAGVDAIMKRGKANVGDKTMLDVLIPVAEALEEGAAQDTDHAALRARVKDVADEGMLSTRDLTARFGRAAFLGERAVGHIDPGAKSSSLIIASICDATA
ncbi:MAG: dihydroxyacetone kinase subunit DhaL [Pseudomonadota bacterium]